MTDKNNNDAVFHNADTLCRRAWIDLALAGVRSQLGSSFSALEFGEPGCVPALATPVYEADAAAEAAEQGSEARPPALYVAWSAGARRSGT